MQRRNASALGAVPDFVLAGAALVTWVNPTLLGADKVVWFLGMMLLEFIVIHSAAFLGNVAFGEGTRAEKVKKSIQLSLFYSVFALAFALSIKDAWPLLAFWGLTANRLLGVMLGAAPSGEARAYAQKGWAASVMFYMLGVALTLLFPLPELGITREMLSGPLGEISGAWAREPHRVVAFAAIYFGAQGLFGLQGLRRVGGAPTQQRA